jgi:hypothetical protein
VCRWRNTQGDGPTACPPVCCGPSICGWGLNLSWKRRFDDPIVLPDGRRLDTLQDAGTYIAKLPKAEHEAPEWQAAMEALLLVATLGGPTMFARIGVMRALNRHAERVFNHDRKDKHWGEAKLARER